MTGLFFQSRRTVWTGLLVIVGELVQLSLKVRYQQRPNFHAHRARFETPDVLYIEARRVRNFRSAIGSALSRNLVRVPPIAHRRFKFLDVAIAVHASEFSRILRHQDRRPAAGFLTL